MSLQIRKNIINETKVRNTVIRNFFAKFKFKAANENVSKAKAKKAVELSVNFAIERKAIFFIELP